MSLLDDVGDLFSKKEAPTEVKEESKQNTEAIDLSNINFKDVGATVSKILNDKYTYYVGLIGVLLLGLWIRTRNLNLLQGKYLLGLDPYLSFRHAKEILSGAPFLRDMMRHAPIGQGIGTSLIKIDAFAHMLAAWDKLVMSFGQTQLYAHIIYPAVFGVIGFIFFFLFVKELFNEKVGLVATAFLAVISSYLYRTLAGFADHEAMAMVFMYAALWMFVVAFKEDKLKKKYLFAGVSGILTCLMALSWRGYTLLTLGIASFAIIALIFNRADKKFSLMYSIWVGAFVIPFSVLYGLQITVAGVFIPVLSLALLWINFFFSKLKISNYLSKYLPKNIQSLLITIGLGFVLNAFLNIFNVSAFIAQVTQPAEQSGRVAHTISEITASTNLYSAFNLFLIFGAIAVVYLVYLTFRDLKRTAAFSIPISLFIVPAFFQRYALKVYLNLMIILVIAILGVFFYFYRKQGEEFFDNINPIYFLPIIFILFVTYLAKSAARFLFLFSPIIALLAAVSITSLIVFAIERPEKIAKFAGVLLIIFVCYLVYSNATVTANQAKHSGSGLPGAWENSFIWLRDNTPEDSIVTHWWDYGYWTQTIGERASTHDGGTHGEHELFILGRYGMTAQTPEDALTFFKTYEVDYLLYSEEEIGKYHAFSYIGSNKDFDRRSTIGVFSLQQQQEVRNGTKLIYGGQWGLDKDIVLNNKVFAEGSSAIVGFTVNKIGGALVDPVAYLSEGSNPIQVPISCMCVAGQCTEQQEDSVLNGCVVVIPYFSSQSEGDELGAILYLSEKVKDGLFARLYVKRLELEGFEEVYNDNVPLAVYQGRVVGPKMIWKVTPPEYIEKDPQLLWNNTAIYGYEKDFRKNYED